MPDPNYYLRTDAERGREAASCLKVVGVFALVIVLVCVVINFATGIW